MLSTEQRQTLLDLAKQSIAYGLEHNRSLPLNAEEYDNALQQQRATFVTLHINDNLRGCIGTLAAIRPLVEDIVHNAYAAAFSDPRFPSLSKTEYNQLHYHISILSESSPMKFSSESDLLSQLQPGVDGLILEDLGRRGTFLPSVWEQLPAADDFFNHLKQKAGLPMHYWSDSLKVSRYSVESFS